MYWLTFDNLVILQFKMNIKLNKNKTCYVRNKIFEYNKINNSKTKYNLLIY